MRPKRRWKRIFLSIGRNRPPRIRRNWWPMKLWAPGISIFCDDSPAGDGLLTAVKIASLVSMNGRLESLVTGLKEYPQIIVNVRVKSKPPLESLPQVSRALAAAQSALGDNGRVVLRYSGTEPLARVMVEAEHDEDVQRFSESVANALRESIGA